MSDLNREFAANVLAYQDIAIRKPRLFLQRNLNKALDAHQRRLAQQTDAETPWDTMIANTWNAKGWDFPTPRMLEQGKRGPRPVLNVGSLQLRLLKSNGNAGLRQQQISARPKDPLLDWLPNPDVGLRLPCQVVVTVHGTTGGNGKKEVFHRSRRCIIAQHTDTGGENYFEIETDPFEIELDEFFLPVDAGKQHGFRWKKTMTAKYTLEASVHCQDPKQSADLLSCLESCPVARSKNAPFIEGKVRATWELLPKCPVAGCLLPLKRARGHDLWKLDNYGMSISMGWTRKKATVLEIINRSHVPLSLQLPTPSSSDAHDVKDTMESQQLVRYVRHLGIETEAIEQEGLKCIFCANADRDGQTGMYQSKSALRDPVASLDRLLLHYWSFHSAYDWEKTATTVMPSGKELVTIEVRPQRKSKAVDSTLDPWKQDFTWIAPDRPFDIKAHLAGDESWTGGSEKRHVKSDGRGRRGVGLKDVEHVAVKKPLKRAEDVESLLPHKRKRNIMPADGEFYHSTSKAAVRIGEPLSESEDEGADDRLLHSQRHNLCSHGLSPDAVKFHEALNRHIDIEQPAGRAAKRDAIVRFANLQSRENHSKAWIEAFEAKLEFLHEHRVIDEDALSYCLRSMDADHRPKAEDASLPGKSVLKDSDGDTIMDEHKDLASSINGQPRSNGKFATRTNTQTNRLPKKPHKWNGGGADKDIIAHGGASSSPKVQIATSSGTTASSKPAKTELGAAEHPRACKCGIRVQGPRGSISCENADCVTSLFHLACVGLDRRQLGWRCEACSA
ncbi:hypothetical protein LTR27_007428 [Elasticomyces elasticus]|nr:hypothetical protein LTR27_007428 [Elasticomyces elasticus]